LGARPSSRTVVLIAAWSNDNSLQSPVKELQILCRAGD
jgi:hypothetical protein